MQNYKNHRRFSRIYHFIGLPLALAGIILSSIMLVRSFFGSYSKDQCYSKSSYQEVSNSIDENLVKPAGLGDTKNVIIKKMITVKNPPMHHEGKHKMPAVLFFILSISVLISLINGRASALKAQNRAIRAEESLRHFILSGKPINSSLRLGQIIALRFASDDELLSLSEKAVIENLSSKQIKTQIKLWKADNHRV